MRGIRRLAATGGMIALLMGIHGGSAGASVDPIVGTWHGSSICTDRKTAPACKDEEVVYEIMETAGKPDAVTVKADKIVGGKREPMGEIEFTRDEKDGGWSAEVSSPRMHAIWRLAVAADRMSGTLVLLPSKAVVRKVDLQRNR